MFQVNQKVGRTIFFQTQITTLEKKALAYSKKNPLMTQSTCLHVRIIQSIVAESLNKAKSYHLTATQYKASFNIKIINSYQ